MRSFRTGDARPLLGSASAALLCLCSALVGSCSPRSLPLPQAELGLAPELCAPAAAPAGGSIHVALPDRALPSRAPVPANEVEALVFAHLYQTLAVLGCGPEPEPELARSWGPEQEGRVWFVELAPDHRFSDGHPVDAAAVREGWIWQQRRQRRGEAPWRWIDPDSVSVAGPLRLRIALDQPCASFPHLLTHPALSVMRPSADRRDAPIGTGCGVPRQWRATELELAPNDEGSLPPWQALHFRFAPNKDPRDLLADGADVVLLRDREISAEVRARQSHQVLDLPENRTYFWLPGPHAGRLGSGAWIDGELRRELAELVVHAPATVVDAANAPLWDQLICAAPDSSPGVEEPGGPLAVAPRDPTGVAFNWTDATARELAERLAAIATQRGGGKESWSVAPLPPHEFRRALRRGDYPAMIVSLGGGAGSSLLQERSVHWRIPWIAAAEHEPRALLRTRGVLVAVPELMGMRCRYDGVLLFDRTGRRQP